MSNVHRDIETLEKQVEITRNTMRATGIPARFRNDGKERRACRVERRRSFKGSNHGIGEDGASKKEKDAGAPWRSKRDREDMPTGHGTIIRWRNGMRFWNFVLFVRPVISIDESRGRRWSPLRVFYGDISRGLTSVIFQMGPIRVWSLSSPRRAREYYCISGAESRRRIYLEKIYRH